LRIRHPEPTGSRRATPTSLFQHATGHSRKHGISEPTFYAWKAKFGGMSVSDARRLKQLEEENAKLKTQLAEAMLDNAVLKDITSRKW
jgi:transposase-like protein